MRERGRRKEVEVKREAGRVREERMDGGTKGAREAGEKSAWSMQRSSMKCRDIEPV